MNEAPVISVVIPTHNAGPFLPLVIAALLKSDLPRKRWELIVVDDVSPGGAPKVPGADSVLDMHGTPRGPAAARNTGAEAARAPLVAFVDADVCVRPDVLRRLVEHFRRDSELAGVFGSYDASPAEPGFISQYRNLLHHYVHQQKSGDVESFWAGCGAVRRAAFLEVGMFDQARYTTPQIEDIELGYRLRDRGYRIILDPQIQGTHLKRWTFRGMVRANFQHRGLPYARLLLERRRLLSSQGLSVGSSDKASTVLIAVTVMAIACAVVFRDWRWLIGTIACIAAFVLVNRRLLGWFARVRGPWFAARAALMHLVYHATNVAALGYSVITHSLKRRSERSAPSRAV
ncbi:MAG TPA: glycosyltransferase [Gemmatimonadaceae bacterium]|nr:glycosyltransferase [Gemmatimonadaceae bacterium]